MNRSVKLSIYLLIGVVLLLVLFQLVRLEKNKSTINLAPLEIENDSIKSKSMMIKITDNNDYFLDEKLVKFEDLENKVLMKRNSDSIKTIVIKAEKAVQVNNIVKVMEIANKNEFKVIMSVRPD